MAQAAAQDHPDLDPLLTEILGADRLGNTAGSLYHVGQGLNQLDIHITALDGAINTSLELIGRATTVINVLVAARQQLNTIAQAGGPESAAGVAVLRGNIQRYLNVIQQELVNVRGRLQTINQGPIVTQLPRLQRANQGLDVALAAALAAGIDEARPPAAGGPGGPGGPGAAAGAAPQQGFIARARGMFAPKNPAVPAPVPQGGPTAPAIQLPGRSIAVTTPPPGISPPNWTLDVPAQTAFTTAVAAQGGPLGGGGQLLQAALERAQVDPAVSNETLRAAVVRPTALLDKIRDKGLANQPTGVPESLSILATQLENNPSAVETRARLVRERAGVGAINRTRVGGKRRTKKRRGRKSKQSKRKGCKGKRTRRRRRSKATKKGGWQSDKPKSGRRTPSIVQRTRRIRRRRN
jgi:hypothetical protein